MKSSSSEELKRKIRELEAQLIHRHYFASVSIDKATGDRLKGSGVIISMIELGGRVIIEPVCINNGLSAETIAALRRDIARSYDYATELKPKGH